MGEDYFDFIDEITDERGIIKTEYIELFIKILSQNHKSKCSQCGCGRILNTNIRQIDAIKEDGICYYVTYECEECFKTDFYNFEHIVKKYFKNNEYDIE